MLRSAGPLKMWGACSASHPQQKQNSNWGGGGVRARTAPHPTRPRQCTNPSSGVVRHARQSAHTLTGVVRTYRHSSRTPHYLPTPHQSHFRLYARVGWQSGTMRATVCPHSTRAAGPRRCRPPPPFLHRMLALANPRLHFSSHVLAPHFAQIPRAFPPTPKRQ
jgi:hypothetical protein